MSYETLNKALDRIVALEAELVEARRALDAVNALISCADVKMSGQARYRFITTGQHEAALLVQAARGAK